MSDLRGLDEWITGHYGEDYFDHYCEDCGEDAANCCCSEHVAVVDELEHDSDCTCRHCEPEPVDDEERYIHEDES